MGSAEAGEGYTHTKKNHKNQKTTDTREQYVKKLSHYMDQYHQLPEEPVLEWIVRVTNFRGFECYRLKEHAHVEAGLTGQLGIITHG